MMINKKADELLRRYIEGDDLYNLHYQDNEVRFTYDWRDFAPLPLDMRYDDFIYIGYDPGRMSGDVTIAKQEPEHSTDDTPDINEDDFFSVLDFK